MKKDFLIGLLMPILVLIVAVILGGYFYWFEWRPVAIKKECNDLAFKYSHSEYCDEKYYNEYDKTKCIYNPEKQDDRILTDSYDFAYKTCLHDKGL